jgi:hypothetical protein
VSCIFGARTNATLFGGVYVAHFKIFCCVLSFYVSFRSKFPYKNDVRFVFAPVVYRRIHVLFTWFVCTFPMLPWEVTKHTPSRSFNVGRWSSRVILCNPRNLVSTNNNDSSVLCIILYNDMLLSFNYGIVGFESTP